MVVKQKKNMKGIKKIPSSHQKQIIGLTVDFFFYETLVVEAF